MSMIRRFPSEPAWPEWFPARSLFDWSPSVPLIAESDRLRVEEFQENGTLVIRAEMPGIDPEENVEISVSDGVLHLKAERTEATRTDDTRGFRSEFHYGSFARSLRLPAGATEDDIVADYRDGILEVRVPISTEKASAKKIPVAHE